MALTNGTRKRTPQTEFKPYIVALLQEVGGEQHVDDLFAELEARMEPILLPGDYETMPPQNEVRWRYNARWARKALVDDGLLMPPRRPGFWELTSEGRAIIVD
ncbi:winged helix-turn-helix domain-containing protein [Nocardioides sp.]|uniref:winged helix-turn-helix domain-containing protein n=1 Tax=Nocardioides sp. TaxID=35761 RepID=UPI0031FF12F6